MGSRYWEKSGRKYRICVESYEDLIMQGWISVPNQKNEKFSSMMEFLLKMETLLDQEKRPQAYTMPRRFQTLQQETTVKKEEEKTGNCIATFELRVVFRQNSSWQGVLTWRENGQEAYFRSVLELVILLDSALGRNL